MTKRPTHPRPDANQSQIRKDLQASGFNHVICDVSSLSVKKAGVDWYVYGVARWSNKVECLPVEIKTPGEDLNDNERKFWTAVRSLGPSNVPIKAYCAEDILRWFGVLGASTYGWDEGEG